MTGSTQLIKTKKQRKKHSLFQTKLHEFIFKLTLTSNDLQVVSAHSREEKKKKSAAASVLMFNEEGNQCAR